MDSLSETQHGLVTWSCNVVGGNHEVRCSTITKPCDFQKRTVEEARQHGGDHQGGGDVHAHDAVEGHQVEREVDDEQEPVAGQRKCLDQPGLAQQRVLSQ